MGVSRRLGRHVFKKDSFFEDVIDLYNFDRHFRLLVFNAIERIEISLRTKLIYHLSLSYGAEWYLKQSLFRDKKEHNKFLSKINAIHLTIAVIITEGGASISIKFYSFQSG